MVAQAVAAPLGEGGGGEPKMFTRMYRSLFLTLIGHSMPLFRDGQNRCRQRRTSLVMSLFHSVVPLATGVRARANLGGNGWSPGRDQEAVSTTSPQSPEVLSEHQKENADIVDCCCSSLLQPTSQSCQELASRAVEKLD
ncbi:hypothetical protein EYF80_016773 [Liparis tanakae]|uniref:Uncharacterized protein n=1 Tax=Liparis tanakae TaxID=230148 RepID=A0A4Z2I729_9TELE|nr:hypothetical protein EYF80_016773 [Liparis tanakae]